MRFKRYICYFHELLRKKYPNKWREPQIDERLVDYGMLLFWSMLILQIRKKRRKRE